MHPFMHIPVHAHMHAHMQGKCDGGSYAFSSVAALEGAASLALDKLTTLSEQNIIDCSGEYIYTHRGSFYSYTFT